MRSLVASLFLVTLLVAACAEPKAPAPPDGQAGDVCGIAEDQTRKCAFPLECQREPIGAISAEDRERGMAEENGGCGGVAGRRCAKGLACEMPKESMLIADASGTCRQEWRCGAKK